VSYKRYPHLYTAYNLILTWLKPIQIVESRGIEHNIDEADDAEDNENDNQIAAYIFEKVNYTRCSIYLIIIKNQYQISSNNQLDCGAACMMILDLAKRGKPISSNLFTDDAMKVYREKVACLLSTK
jgi:hypothetical protein